MSALARVRSARVVLIAALLTSTAAWAIAAALTMLLAASIVDSVAPLPLGIRNGVLPLAVVAGGIAALAHLLRGRQVFQLERVALFLEERVPTLEYALVTALGSSGAVLPGLERVIDRAEPETALRRPVLRAMGRPLIAAGVLLLAMSVLAPAGGARILRPNPGDALIGGGTGDSLASRLAPLVARVAPPRYSRQPSQELAEPAAVSALVGSRVEIRGRGAARGLDSMAARLGDSMLPVRATSDTWSVAFAMADRPVVLRLLDRTHSRLLSLEPVADQPPSVLLSSPSQDTTFLLPRGRLLLAAGARDDIGIARAEFELMHTTGSGERFDIRGVTLGMITPGGARTVSLEATLLLDTLKLSPGDVLHVRVTATDQNDVTGPGIGASDTRTIRIADPRTRDTVPIISAAVAELDTTMLSQRMLVIRAESLLVQRPRITESVYRERSDVLGKQQGLIQERVEAVIEELTTATDAGFTGHTQSSLILADAVAAMKLARRELGVFRVSVALPHMYRALKALERVRSSNRLYLRGIFPKLVVDLDKVRLKGTDRPQMGARDPREALDDPRAELRSRLDRVLALLAQGAAGVLDSLVLIRVEALTQAEDAAPALAGAIAELRGGRQPLASLRTARRVLLRATETTTGVAAWRGAP